MCIFRGFVTSLWVVFDSVLEKLQFYVVSLVLYMFSRPPLPQNTHLLHFVHVGSFLKNRRRGPAINAPARGHTRFENVAAPGTAQEPVKERLKNAQGVSWVEPLVLRWVVECPTHPFVILTGAIQVSLWPDRSPSKN